MTSRSLSALAFIKRIVSGILDQRTFVVASAICVGIGLLSSYVDIQDRADRELALRFGAPAAVTIQDFERKRHAGRAGEVVFHGEADLDNAVVITKQTVIADVRVLAIPVFPVSDTGIALIGSGDGTDTETLTQQAMRRATTEATDPEVLAVVVLPFEAAVEAGTDTFFFAKQVFGEGRYGTVVTLNGDLSPPEDVEFDMRGAFAVQDKRIASDLTTVWPYLDGRVAALSKSNPLSEHQRFYVLAGVLAAIGGLLHLRNSPSLFWRTPKPVAEDPDEDDYEYDVDDQPAASHPTFAPIPSQNEIAAAEQKIAADQAERDASPSPLKTLAGFGSSLLGRR